MPSGVSNDVADAVLDLLLGVDADTTVMGATLYLDLLVTGPSDDEGTDAVSWDQGRLAVATADATNWPAADGRAKVGTDFELPANSSGATITVVAFAWYTASSGGTYKGGAPVPGDSLDVPDGVAPVITPTLSSPTPS